MPDLEYPKRICQECGEECAVSEEVATGWNPRHYNELWCYCEKCDIETFHPLPDFTTLAIKPPWEN